MTGRWTGALALILLAAGSNLCRRLGEWCDRRADRHETHPVDLIRDAWIARQPRMTVYEGPGSSTRQSTGSGRNGTHRA
jgi:hypothetical protein